MRPRLPERTNSICCSINSPSEAVARRTTKWTFPETLATPLSPHEKQRTGQDGFTVHQRRGDTPPHGRRSSRRRRGCWRWAGQGQLPRHLRDGVCDGGRWVHQRVLHEGRWTAAGLRRCVRGSPATLRHRLRPRLRASAAGVGGRAWSDVMRITDQLVTQGSKPCQLSVQELLGSPS